jgi:hypothetical protein
MNHSQLKFYHIFTPGKDLEKPPLEIWVSLSHLTLGPHSQSVLIISPYSTVKHSENPPSVFGGHLPSRNKPLMKEETS